MRSHKTLEHVGSILLMLICASYVASGQTSGVKQTQPKQTISEQELLSLFRAGKSIENRTIRSATLISALRWIQKAVEKDEQLLYETLVINESEIIDELDFSELEETTAEDLREDLRVRYNKIFGFPLEGFSVVIVPISIKITSSSIKRIQADAIIFERSSSLDFSSINTTSFRDSTFEGGAMFEQTNFKDSVDFRNTFFESRASFNHTTFEFNANFEKATFLQGINFSSSVFKSAANFGGATFQGETHIVNTDFRKEADFSQANILGTLHFHNSKFQDNVFFIDLNKDKSGEDIGKSMLVFSGANFSGRLYLTNATLDKLLFPPTAVVVQQLKDDNFTGDTKSVGDKPSREPSSPTTIDKRAIFAGLICNVADFTEVEFRDYVDFNRAHFKSLVNLTDVTFEKEVNFYGTQFPEFSNRSPTRQGQSKSGVILDGIQFQKIYNLEWMQISGKLNSSNTETWSRLEDAFKRSGNLEGLNEALYQRRRQEGAESKELNYISNQFEYVLWGYGVRPLRVVNWLLVAFTLFTCIYYTQTEPLVKGKSKLSGKWERLKYAVDFSLRTSWTIGYGYKNSRTSFFKALTLIQSIGFKILLLCLLKSLSNVSPLLNELAGKLLPV